MSPSRPFILRPVATTLLMAAIMLVGMFAFNFLPLSALPEVDYPTIQVQTFYPGASLDVAEQEVQAAINAAGNLLPSDLPAPPIYAKVNPADAPILTLALTSKTIPLPQVEDLADTRMVQKLSQLPGVGLVSISRSEEHTSELQS